MMRKPSQHHASLQCNGLPEAQRRAAEEKYLALLEQAFGSASKVRGAYCEFVAVQSLRAENPWDTATPAELESLTRWKEAAQAARNVVFSDMKIGDNDAYFELHVWNSHSA
jgi:hypothetical protein